MACADVRITRVQQALFVKMYLKTRVQYEVKLRAAPLVTTAAGNGYSSWRQPIASLAVSVKYKRPMPITFGIFYC